MSENQEPSAKDAVEGPKADKAQTNEDQAGASQVRDPEAKGRTGESHGAGIEDHSEERRHPVVARFAPKKPKTATGSRLRDHLANERTELAWIRTGISLIALGVAIDKFLLTDNQSGKDIGTIVVFAGLFAMIYSTFTYVVVQRRIERDVYRPHLFGPLFLSGILTVGGVFALIWVF